MTSKGEMEGWMDWHSWYMDRRSMFKMAVGAAAAWGFIGLTRDVQGNDVEVFEIRCDNSKCGMTVKYDYKPGYAYSAYGMRCPYCAYLMPAWEMEDQIEQHHGVQRERWS